MLFIGSRPAYVAGAGAGAGARVGAGAGAGAGAGVLRAVSDKQHTACIQQCSAASTHHSS